MVPTWAPGLDMILSFCDVFLILFPRGPQEAPRGDFGWLCECFLFDFHWFVDDFSLHFSIRKIKESDMLSLFLDLSSELHHLLSVVFYLLSLFRVQEIIYVKILRKEPKCLRTYYLQYRHPFSLFFRSCLQEVPKRPRATILEDFSSIVDRFPMNRSK